MCITNFRTFFSYYGKTITDISKEGQKLSLRCMEYILTLKWYPWAVPVLRWRKFIVIGIYFIDHTIYFILSGLKKHWHKIIDAPDCVDCVNPTWCLLLSIQAFLIILIIRMRMPRAVLVLHFYFILSIKEIWTFIQSLKYYNLIILCDRSALLYGYPTGRNYFEADNASKIILWHTAILFFLFCSTTIKLFHIYKISTIAYCFTTA